jgi:hypothetical protein
MSSQQNGVAFILVDSDLIVFINGKTYNLNDTHPNFTLVMNELLGKKRAKTLEKLVNVRRSIEKFMRGRIRVDVDKEEVLYKGQKVEPVITKRIVDFMRQGLDARPLVRFLDKLYQNPSKRALQEAFKFIEHQGMPLTNDGCFIAYKGINNDWFDIHSRTILNRVGKTISILRNEVDDNFGVACSQGLHVGSYSYAKSFGSNGKVILVKINPADIVSVPTDCSCQKCRVCKYKVVAEYVSDEPIKGAIYTNQ